MTMIPTKEELITDIIRNIGDHPGREGLLKTPDRVIRSWKELYSGYEKNPADIFTVFDSEGHDEIVLLKNIEFFSTCEHHMLPFFGKAHIAYIPDEKIVGISKLARLLEIYSRRLQVQERIGMQVVRALDEFLKPLGSACILEAQHFCMISRGVNKQNSIMVTSALTGAFKSEHDARNELMRLING